MAAGGWFAAVNEEREPCTNACHPLERQPVNRVLTEF